MNFPFLFINLPIRKSLNFEMLELKSIYRISSEYEVAL